MITKVNSHEDLQIKDGITMFVFSSPDCVPCRYINPIMDKYASDHPNIHIYRINCYELPELADEYNVNSVPTIFFHYKKELKHIFKSVAGIKHHLDLYA